METLVIAKAKTEALPYVGNVCAPYTTLIKVLGRPENEEGTLFVGHTYRWDFILISSRSDNIGYFCLWSAEPWVERRKQKIWHLASSKDRESALALIMKLTEEA